VQLKISPRPAPFFIVILICAIISSALAQQKQFPAYTGHVNDFANILDQETKQKLELWLTNFENKTGAQIAVVTVTSLEGRPIEEYANELYRAWGIGAKTGEHKDKGALLLVAVQDRKTRLEVGYGLEGDLPDGLAGEIIRRMRPGLQQGRYSEAMTTGVRTLSDPSDGKRHGSDLPSYWDSRLLLFYIRNLQIQRSWQRRRRGQTRRRRPVVALPDYFQSRWRDLRRRFVGQYRRRGG
jgi:uncharacterized membrane protein YgcG